MEYDLDLREYWRILRNRKSIIFFAAFVMGICSFGFSYTNKPAPVYETSSTVKIEKSSTTTGIYLEALSWSGADFLETQASIITSYPIMELVAKEMGIIDEDLAPSFIRTDSNLIGVVLELKGKVTAEREGNSNLIDIIIKSNHPKEAQTIANTVARVYTQVHTEEVNKRTFESRKFIEDQITRVADKLTLAEERSRDFRERQNILSLDSQTKMLLDKLAVTEAEYMDVKESVEMITFMLDRLDRTVKEGGQLSEKESFYVPNSPPLYDNLNNKLVSLLLEKDVLLLTFTEEHPKVKEIDSQFKEIAQNMRANLREKKVTVTQKAESLEIDLVSYQAQLETLPEKRLQLARLERDIKLNEKVYSLLEEKLHEAKIMEAAKIEEVIIVKPALEPNQPLRGSMVPVKTFIGVFLGLFLGVISAFLYEMFDTSINAIKDIEEFIGVSVLGVIPLINLKQVREEVQKTYKDEDITDKTINQFTRLISHYIPNSTIAECFRSLRTNIEFAGIDKEQKIIAFTSSLSDEGKTMAVVNTAIGLAQSPCRVLLIEADLRKPSIAKWFGIDSEPGLSEIIMGSYDWREAVRDITDMMLGEMSMEGAMHTPGLDNLHIITSGRVPPNPSELLNSKTINSFFKELKDHYDVILVDLPPILSAADTSITSAKVDSVVLVYKAGETARGALRRAKTQLEHARANVIGVILNGLKAGSSVELGPMGHQRYYGLGEKGEGDDPSLRQSLVGLGKEMMHHDTAGTGKKVLWGRLGVVLLAIALLVAGLMMV